MDSQKCTSKAKRHQTGPDIFPARPEHNDWWVHHNAGRRAEHHVYPVLRVDDRHLTFPAGMFREGGAV